MRLFRVSIFVAFYMALSPTLIPAQTFVYSGRQYLQRGQSWAQIREMDLRTWRSIQLSTSPRQHYRPWCTPDNKSILFTSEIGDKTLYRFDRATKQETAVATLEENLFAVVGAVGDSQIMLQEYGAIIEIIDLTTGRHIRRILGSRPSVSADGKLLAWQSRVDPLSKVEPHILLSQLKQDAAADLGEGRAPVFAGPSERLFFRHQTDATMEVVRYNTGARTEQVRTVNAPEYGEVEDATFGPDGTTLVISTGGGRYNTAVYWRLTAAGGWTLLDDNLHEWGGWAPDGRLIYSTDGRDLRALDSKRSVWVGDVKLLDPVVGKTETIVSGVSMNQSPRWCGDVH